MQDKEAKQEFLRNQIILGGFDPESFMDFMGTIKQEGQNIQLDQWTMQDLKDLVTNFKGQIVKDASTIEDIRYTQTEFRGSKQMISNIIKSNIKMKKVVYDKGLWDYQIDTQHECKTIPKAFEFKSQPKVQITKWEVKTHGGFFLGLGATKQLWVTIETNFLKQPICRTNADFQWFRNALHKLYPGSYIPPLAELRSIEPEDKKGLTHRTKLMQQFLRSLCKYEWLIQNNITKLFLEERDHAKFNQMKTKERNTNYPNNIARIQTFDGKFKVQISQQNLKHNKNSSGFAKVALQLYQEAQLEINKVLADMESLGKHILQISNTCGTLHQKYSKICGLNNIEESTMETIMIYLNNMFANMGKNIKNQMHVIKEFNSNYVQYSVRTWEQFLLFDKRHQRVFQNYLNFKTDLQKKKEKNFLDITKWEIEGAAQMQKVSSMNIQKMQKEEVYNMMYPKQNQMEEELRIWIAYQNRMYQDSFKSLLLQEENQLKEKFALFVDCSQKLSQENHQSVKQFQQILVAS